MADSELLNVLGVVVVGVAVTSVVAMGSVELGLREGLATQMNVRGAVVPGLATSVATPGAGPLSQQDGWQQNQIDDTTKHVLTFGRDHLTNSNRKVKLGQDRRLDDSVLDKPYAKQIDLIGRHWSGKHHAVVQGIDLVSLPGTDGDRHVPRDYRIYHDAKLATKNDHFRAMLLAAHGRGFRPSRVLFDGSYSGLENLKLLRALGWAWLTRLKANRLVNKDRQGTRPFSRTEVAARPHIGLAPRAFLRLELYGFTHGVSWLEAKTAIIRDAVRSYLAHPWIRLSTA